MTHTNETHHQQGIALLGALVLVLILSLLGATMLNLAGQEAISANVGREAVVAQQLADAAGELVVSWFHSPKAGSISSRFSSALGKKNRNSEGTISFFDQSGRSQFVGTASQPDLHVDAGVASDDRVLHDPETGLFRAMQRLGTIEELKVYAPSSPGLLCTVEATVVARTPQPVRQSVLMELGALDLPPLQAAVQVTQNLGLLQPGSEASVRIHWGDLKVGGSFVVARAEEIPVKSILASVTGQGYDETAQREDRWMDAWVGGEVHVRQLLPSGEQPVLPPNVHQQQHPVPGIRLDQWNYEYTKRIAQRHGRYFAIDQDGFLYPHGVVTPGERLTPEEVFRSESTGDHRGLIFVDTLDQTAPRADNLGVLRLHTAYLEGVVVMQGHVVIAPGGSGQSIDVLSPPDLNEVGDAGRRPVQLPRVNFNGVLSAAGNITVAGQARVYGAVVAGGTIVSSSGGTLEVWYDHDLSEGLFRGLPLVYRAPGAWVARY